MAEIRIISMPGGEHLSFTGTQGWRQFLTARQKMLDAYDRARSQARAHEVEVFHGRVAEAQVREWLASFLPKRYGVTSGYIVSQGQTESTRLPHFDVIIYDQIETPILWIEDNPDSTAVGTSRAIPAEYVRSVLEVKAAFNASSVSAAFAHLSDLDCLLTGVDPPNDRYKRFLPQRFFTFIIFFELRDADRNSWQELFKFVPDTRRVWPGGVVLRGHGLQPEFSATIGLNYSTNSPPVPVGPAGRDLLDTFVLSESKWLGETYWSARCRWSPNEFSTFAFDLLAMLSGTYDATLRSSNHAQAWLDFSKQPK